MMTKSETRELSKALAYAAIDPAMAARSIACLHRAASKKTQAELFAATMAVPAVMARISIINDCWITD